MNTKKWMLIAMSIFLINTNGFSKERDFCSKAREKITQKVKQDLKKTFQVYQARNKKVLSRLLYSLKKDRSTRDAVMQRKDKTQDWHLGIGYYQYMELALESFIRVAEEKKLVMTSVKCHSDGLPNELSYDKNADDKYVCRNEYAKTVAEEKTELRFVSPDKVRACTSTIMPKGKGSLASVAISEVDDQELCLVLDLNSGKISDSDSLYKYVDIDFLISDELSSWSISQYIQQKLPNRCREKADGSGGSGTGGATEDGSSLKKVNYEFAPESETSAGEAF